jgi:hypothetical protein
MRHPRDPIAAHHAADRFGRLVAAGLLRHDEARSALRAAAARAAAVDQSGLQTRLCHALADSRADWALRRGRAAWRVRDSVAPLLATWAPAATVLREAAAAAGEDLEAGESAAIATAMAAAQLRRSA